MVGFVSVESEHDAGPDPRREAAAYVLIGFLQLHPAVTGDGIFNCDVWQGSGVAFGWVPAITENWAPEMKWRLLRIKNTTHLWPSRYAFTWKGNPILKHCQVGLFRPDARLIYPLLEVQSPWVFLQSPPARPRKPKKRALETYLFHTFAHSNNNNLLHLSHFSGRLYHAYRDS